MNKSWLVAALGVVGALGALYATLTRTAPAALTGPAALAMPLPSEVAAPLASAASSTEAAASAAAAETLETARLDARRQLYESVDALLQASEVEKARKLLDEDLARYGDDLAPEWHDLEQSYRLIADCLEHPSAKLRVRAESFVLVSQAAGLKARILSACAKSPPR